MIYIYIYIYIYEYKNYLTHWICEYASYLYHIMICIIICIIILICENIFKSNAFFVYILMLKFDFNSIWISSCSCSCQKVSMYKIRFTKIRRKKSSKGTIVCKTLRKESSNSGGRKLPGRNRIRKRRKVWRLKI